MHLLLNLHNENLVLKLHKYQGTLYNYLQIKDFSRQLT